MAERRKSYAEQLKDVRWQKKRLEILERDQYKCQRCWAEDSRQLHVHHTYYERGKPIWEHDEKYLVALCEGCHSNAQALMDAVYRWFGMYHDLDERLVGYIVGHHLSLYWTSEYELPSDDFSTGLADGAAVPRTVIREAYRQGMKVSGHAVSEAWWRYRLHEHPNMLNDRVALNASQHSEYLDGHGGRLPEVGIAIPLVTDEDPRQQPVKPNPAPLDTDMCFV